MENSDFFTTPIYNNRYTELTLQSESGFNAIYSLERDGKRFVAKALREMHRGTPLYESLLRKEFEIGYGMEHPNICRTYSFEHLADEGNAIVMEWVDGRTLDRYIAEKRRSEGELLRIAFQLCDALSYAHKRQTIHRDLKPQNIIVTHNGDNVKLLDFGLSDTDYHTTLKEPAGSRKYASPELLRGEKVDLRADIYSLGVIIDELFEGRKSQRIAQIVARATSFYPDSRYSDADGVVAAFGGRSTRAAYVVVALAVILSLIGYLFYVVYSRDEALVPSAQVDGVSVEEFERRRMLSNDFFREINNSYILINEKVYKTDCATPDMPSFSELSREQVIHYKSVLDSMMGSIKHSSLYTSAQRNLNFHNSELFTIMRNGFPAMFWLNTERRYRKSKDSLCMELKKLPAPRYVSNYMELSYAEQQAEQNRYRQSEREYNNLTVRVWAEHYRKIHNLTPLPEELLRYYE